jgi:hypothetical protein
MIQLFEVRTRSQTVNLRLAYEAGERELQKLVGLNTGNNDCEKCLKFHSSQELSCIKKERESFVGKFRNATCSICLEKFLQTPKSKLEFTRCGHVFHRLCLNRSFGQGRNSCPNCNFALGFNQNNIRIYFN